MTGIVESYSPISYALYIDNDDFKNFQDSLEKKFYEPIIKSIRDTYLFPLYSNLGNIDEFINFLIHMNHDIQFNHLNDLIAMRSKNNSS